MVTVGGEHRYYGRAGTTNVLLTEGEIARLYAQREQWEQDAGDLMLEAIEQTPVPHDDYAYLHVVAQPVVAHSDLLARAIGNEDPHFALNSVVQGLITPEAFPGVSHSNALDGFLGRWRRVVDGWGVELGSIDLRAIDSPKMLDYLKYLEVRDDGSGWLFVGRVGARPADAPRLLVFEWRVAEFVTCFVAIIAELYRRATFIGPVNLALMVSGIQGAASYALRGVLPEGYPYRESEYVRHDRRSALELSDTTAVAQDLVMPLIDALTQGRYSPFT